MHVSDSHSRTGQALRQLPSTDSPLTRTFQPLMRLGLLLLLLTFPLFSAQAAPSPEAQARQIWQLLDYIAVDYSGAVANHQILKASEFAEMQEFAAKARHQLAELGGSQALQQQAAALQNAVAAKAEPATVAQLAHSLASAVQKAYPFPTAPASTPDLARGAALFQTQCAACHGTTGHADGPLAASLNPKPIALADPVRARERSLLALHQVISNGVPDTAMRSFSSLSDADRWALAFFVGSLSYTPDDQTTGAKLWQTRPATHQALPNLTALTQSSEQALAGQLDASSARAVMAYLRTHPAALAENQPGSLALVRAKLAESLTAFQTGDREAASQLALSAYLDGFEPIEPTLALRDHALFEKLETGMVAYRALLAKGSLAEIQAAQHQLQSLLDAADRVLAPAKNDATAAFIGALTILLREGLEALLVVVGMLAFLKKAQRQDLLIYVHAGWISALAAGGLTWGAATYLVAISGASREMTEGFSSLFAAIVLLAVGTWMHQKSVAGRWQIYLKEKLSSALNRRTVWFLFSLAFIAVYREVFETVLFYAALWSEGNGWPLLAGLGTGVLLLALLALLLLRTSARLPIGQFFTASSAMVAVLAVVLAGKGIAGLQEAGLLPNTPLALPKVELLGIFPSWQTLAAQLLMLLIVAAAFLLNLRSARRPASATAQRATEKPITKVI